MGTDSSPPSELHDAPAPTAHGLDPDDWTALRGQGHRMLDDLFDYLQGIRMRPVWRPITPDARARVRYPLNAAPQDPTVVHQRFMADVLPYALGNVHPGFMGWLHGGGTAIGMLAEMVAAGLNANLGGRDQMPVEVERQVVRWMAELFGFPDAAGGLFVTGTSMANLIGLLAARRAALGERVRGEGVAVDGIRLVGYASSAAHGSLARAMDVCGLGSDALRRVPVNAAHQIDVAGLQRAISADRAAGATPFFVAGTAGTVDAGAVDDLAAVAEVARCEGLWFHVDGACGALAILAPDLAARLAGIDRADSLAFDFHKWGQVPYDAGLILVRDRARLEETFASPASYLRREQRGMAAGAPWPCDLGPDLSRGFRALKVWYTLQVYGTERLGRMISGCCAVARHLAARVRAAPQLELAAPVALNVVCFRYRCADADRVNADIAVMLQESGVAAPSTTVIRGRLVLRAAIVNHRTTRRDADALIDAVLDAGARHAASEVPA